MTKHSVGTWLRLIAWFAVLIAAAIMAVDTTRQIERIALVGERPALSTLQTALRVIIVIGAIRLWHIRRHALDRSGDFAS